MQQVKQWFHNYLGTLNLEALFSSFLSKSFQVIFTIILLWLIRQIITRLASLYFHQAQRLTSHGSRQETLESLVKNLIQYIYYFLLTYSILAILGVPVATLLAGAGIASIAVGIGAQGLVTDMVNGMFILLERQIEVGDNVTLNNISGYVEKVGIKTTVIRGYDGTLNFIPNRNIGTVINLSRHPIRTQVDLSYFSDTDLDHFEQIIKAQLHAMSPDQTLTAKPVLMGIVRNSFGQLVYRIKFYCQSGRQDDIQAKYYKALSNALQKAGIHQPESQSAVKTIHFTPSSYSPKDLK
ncbi:small conductance mechanosensitive ion channel family transporter [Aerococcus christensenii]|uniref:Small conductance mechanosensitive ion channel family transporter n=1 Tax=Aerococcus christensenii TaxID=87541 RepID=A0A2I1K7T7_9LACT|nr:mechanosensitive ion channel family protein [Aerococcus christensenii]PKY91647.1 small conductance mechanosensitive ion channel family transporter [Aerococcus christensenii]